MQSTRVGTSAVRARPAAVLLQRPRPFVARPRPILARASDGASTSELVELSKDNYWQYLKSEDNKGVVIVVDCYTDWCGPCKMIYPELVKMSAELEPRARIVKFNCNKYNKELGVQLKIKVAPTFLLYQDGEKVGEMTGAKVEKLRNMITDKLDPSTEDTVPAQLEPVAVGAE